MKRVHPASSTALLVGLGGALWLAATASLAADASKSDDAPARIRVEQRLDAAQKRLERAAQEVAELSMSLSQDEVGTAGKRTRVGRALLGVNIGSDEDEDREEGVEVLNVSPGGGADRAGIKRGDVLLAINNKSLKRDGEGVPRTKLLAVMRGVKPGDKVTVKYRRDDRSRTADIVTKSVSERVIVTPGLGGLEHFEIPPIMFSGAGSILGNAELVPLTPKLGEYFGSERGLLVVRAPSNEALELEEGDVILEIDGRAPNSTSHAMRILSSYQPGEKLTLNVMRKKRRTNIEIVVPESVPRARIERQIERSLRNVPALQQYRRGISVTPPPAPPAPRAPIAAVAPRAPRAPMAPRTPAAPLDPETPDIAIQPLPDVDVQLDDVEDDPR